MNKLKSRSVRALVWDFGARMSSQLVGLFTVVVLARLLGPVEFGTIAVALAVTGFSQIFTDAGLSEALIQRKQLGSTHYSSVFFFNLIAAMGLGCLIYLLAPYIAGFFGNAGITAVLQVLCVLFVVNALGAVQAAKLRRELRYGVIARARLIAVMVASVSGILLAIAGVGVWSLVAQALANAMVYNALLWLRSGWKPGLEVSAGALRQLWDFGLRMFLANLINQVFERIDTLIIARLFPLATLGFYDRAKTINNLLVRYSAASLASVLFPVLSDLQDERERHERIVVNMLALLSLYAFFVVGFFYLLSAELVLVLLSEKWADAIPYLELLVLGGFGAPLGALLLNVLRSRGESRAYLRLEITKKIIRAFCIAFGFLWGIQGYLLGMIFAACAGTYLNVRYAANVMQVNATGLARPILVQLSLAVFSVLVVSALVVNLGLGLYPGALFKAVAFPLIFLCVNVLLRTASYQALRGQLAGLMDAGFKSLRSGR